MQSLLPQLWLISLAQLPRLWLLNLALRLLLQKRFRTNKIKIETRCSGCFKTQCIQKKKSIIAKDSPSNSVVSTFGSVVAEHFFEEDVKILKGRSDVDAEFNFKIGLGDAFFDGLNILA